MNRLAALALAALTLLAIGAQAQYHETNRLVGLHFFPSQETHGGLSAPPVYTGAEAILGDSGGPEGTTNIAGDGGGWLLHFIATDTQCTSAPFWDWAWQGGAFGPTDKTKDGYMSYAFRRATQGGKKNTPIVRVQPSYGRNVPHPSDPYTVTDFAADTRAAAELMKDTARYYVVGNEVNIAEENHRYSRDVSGQKLYDIPFNPTPEEYADMYVAVRDQLAAVAPGGAGAPVALMQPPSPSLAGGIVTMDGNEYLWRQIRRVNQVSPSKLDGFSLHGYAEPGGPDYGTEGYMDSIREQMCIIGQLGHWNKPVFVTEFNKDMPNATEHNIGIWFVRRAFEEMNAWNLGTGGTLPGLPNQDIVGATWFVHPSSGGGVMDGWNRYSLEYWKNQIPSPTDTNCVWHSFRYAALQHYAAGAHGGGAPWPQSASWWRDDFNGSSLDTSPALPDWFPGSGSGGSVSVAGGAVSFRGNGNQFGNADVKTRGYAFGDFALETEFTFTNAAKAATNSPEANFDIRLREGSTGYSITFFSTPSPANPGRIILRRTGLWSQVGSFNVAVPGGINTGDTFKVRAVADGNSLGIRAYKNGAITPVMDWNVSDPSRPNVGWVRVGSYAIAQVDVNYLAMGGPAWDFDASAGIGREAFDLH